jgi:DegV family protein with EDD domain
MSNYVIVTDSNIDLSPEMVNEFGLTVVPMVFEIDGKTYRNYPDNRDMSVKAFYDMLRNKKPATTTQINPAEFEQAWRPLLEAGNDLLSISFSSALSGTYQSALIAKNELEAEFPERKIVCIDSLCASMGQGLFVSYAALLKEEGKSLLEVASYLEDNKQSFCHLFTINDLGHLKRGGRLSASSFVLGSLLNIKPLLHVSKEGQLKVYGKARGRFKAINNMIARMHETFDYDKTKRIYISHGDCLEDAEYAKTLIVEKLGVDKNMIFINPIGPVIGAHSGVNTLAIFYLGNERSLEE